MSKLLVNIRGTNGSGKSTIPLSMMDDKDLKVVSVGRAGKAPYVTVFPTYGWVALGTYYNKTGGMDTFKDNKTTIQAIEFAWNEYPEYNVLMEGVIASTIKSTYVEIFKQYERRGACDVVPFRKIIIMSFLPPLEVCIQRVQSRNGGKKVDEKAIASKWRTVDRNVQYFKDEGFISLRVDTSKCNKDAMLGCFFKTCDKHRKD